MTYGTQYRIKPDINGEQHAKVLVFTSLQSLFAYAKARESDHYRNEYGERRHSKWTSEQLLAMDVSLDPELHEAMSYKR